MSVLRNLSGLRGFLIGMGGVVSLAVILLYTTGHLSFRIKPARIKPARIRTHAITGAITGRA
ncbi:MAG: hypothetical protein IPM55_13545 [Acidobacteria bacterium]|nr:hypothetical protein [Acidobacteriota bacterium]